MPRRRTVDAELPIVRNCVCDKPTVYRDDEDDEVCMRCGRMVKVTTEAKS